MSLPFTTYVVLAGLAGIPDEVYEAARVDGASRWRTYRSVTLPLLRPALVVAIVLNVIYVFNSFPIVWTLNDRNPGFGHDTLITYMYKIAFKSARARRRPGRRARHRQRADDPGRGGRISEDGAVAGGRGLSGRRAAMSGAGGLLALALLSPYLVMLLTALKPEGELRITPRPAHADALAARQLPRRPRRSRLSGLAGELAGGGGGVHPDRPAGGDAGVLLRGAAPVPGRSAFLFVVLVTQMFSPTALVVGLYREFFELGLVNTYAALILTNAAFNLAFAIWILRAFFASIPREIEEAAAVDGCGRVRTLLQVVLPLSLPGLVTAVVFAFIAAWNEYIVALTLMSDPARKPLTVGITSYVTAYVQHWNQLFAAAVIAIVPVVVLFALIERHLVGGLTAGSVK